jgi:hypothetical protein
MYIWSPIYLYTRQYISNSHYNTLEPDRLQHDRPTPACVITQQYSPTTYVSLHLHNRKEDFGARFKNVIIHFTFF